jgi:phosphatidylserine decarboxylase
MDALKDVIVPINREGHRFIAIFVVATVILFWIADPLGWLGVLLTSW